MQKQLLVICFFFLWAGCKNSDVSIKKGETKEEEKTTLRFQVQENGNIVLVNHGGEPYCFDDEAKYDEWVYYALLSKKICEELHCYEEEKINYILPITNKKLIELQNEYINYTFELPIKKQIEDEDIKHCLNRVYYEYRNAKLYLRDEGYGYKCYGLISLKSINVKLFRQEDTGHLVIDRSE